MADEQQPNPEQMEQEFRSALNELMFRLHTGAGSSRPVDAWSQYGEGVVTPKAELVKDVVPTTVSNEIVAEAVKDPTESVQKALAIASQARGRTEALYVESTAKSPEVDVFTKAYAYLYESSLAHPTHLQKAAPTVKCAGPCGFRHYAEDMILAKSGPAAGKQICAQCAGRKSVVGNGLTPAGDEKSAKINMTDSPSSIKGTGTPLDNS